MNKTKILEYIQRFTKPSVFKCFAEKSYLASFGLLFGSLYFFVVWICSANHQNWLKPLVLLFVAAIFLIIAFILAAKPVTGVELWKYRRHILYRIGAAGPIILSAVFGLSGSLEGVKNNAQLINSGLVLLLVAVCGLSLEPYIRHSENNA